MKWSFVSLAVILLSIQLVEVSCFRLANTDDVDFSDDGSGLDEEVIEDTSIELITATGLGAVAVPPPSGGHPGGTAFSIKIWEIGVLRPDST